MPKVSGKTAVTVFDHVSYSGISHHLGCLWLFWTCWHSWPMKRPLKRPAIICSSAIQRIPPRRSVSMGSSLDIVDKDVYYWEPKSLRIRRCEVRSSEAWDETGPWVEACWSWNQGKRNGKSHGKTLNHPESMASSLCPHCRTTIEHIENGTPGWWSVAPSAFQHVPPEFDAEPVLNHQQMFLNWINCFNMVAIILLYHYMNIVWCVWCTMSFT